MSPDHQMSFHGGRLFAMAWMGVYPMVTLISWLFGGVLLALPLPIRTLVLSGLMVGYMVFFWMPFIQRVSTPPDGKRAAFASGDGPGHPNRLEGRGDRRKTHLVQQPASAQVLARPLLGPSLVSQPGSVSSHAGLADGPHQERKTV